MLSFLLRRLLLLVPMMVLMSVVAFALIQAPPGNHLTDYVAYLENRGEVVDLEVVAALEKRYGLD